MYLDVDVETRRGGKMGSEDVAFCQQDVVQNRSVNMRRFSSWYGVGAGERGRQNIPFWGSQCCQEKGTWKRKRKAARSVEAGLAMMALVVVLRSKRTQKRFEFLFLKGDPHFHNGKKWEGLSSVAGVRNPDHRRPVIPLRNRISMLAGLRCSMKDTAERRCRNAGIGAHPLCPRGMMSMLGRDMFVGGGQEGLRVVVRSRSNKQWSSLPR